MPSAPRNPEELDALLAEPDPRLIELLPRIGGDVLVLGASGKMGVTLALAARNAVHAAGNAHRQRIIAAARFTRPEARRTLDQAGVTTIQADLLEREHVDRLPDAENVVFMVGRKFGTGEAEDLTWATNTVAPANVAQRFPRSRIVAFSTGCVYPLVGPETGGCDEKVPPDPVGSYAQACLARERIFEFFARQRGVKVCLVRLNYAIDLRYGVLHDLARTILRGEAVDLAMGWFNCIWQGDANNRALLALEHCTTPASVLNLTGPETLSTRAAAEELGRALGREVRFRGAEQPTAYLNDARRALSLFGPPTVPLDRMIEWTAAWQLAGGPSLGLPTHFEVRDGKY